MIIVDERAEEQKKTATIGVVARDNFLSAGAKLKADTHAAHGRCYLGLMWTDSIDG